jgi:hypothetical protein
MGLEYQATIKPPSEPMVYEVLTFTGRVLESNNKIYDILLDGQGQMKLYRRPKSLPTSSQFKPEMAVATSPVKKAKNLSCQALLVDQGMNIIGNCFRKDDYIVFPAHCLSGASYIASSSGLLTNYVVVDKSRVRRFGGFDLVCLKLLDSDFAKLGVSKASSFGPARINQVVQTVGYNPDTRCFIESTGNLGEETVNGCVKHFCSTTPGMSGSLIMNGRIIIGIHVGALPNSDCNTALLWSVVSFPFYVAFKSKQFKSGKVKFDAVEIEPESLWEDDDQYFKDVIQKFAKGRNVIDRFFNAYGDDDAIDGVYTSQQFAREIEQLIDDGWGEDLDFEDLHEVVSGNVGAISNPRLRKKVHDMRYQGENATPKEEDFRHSSMLTARTSIEPLPKVDVQNSSRRMKPVSKVTSQEVTTLELNQKPPVVSEESSIVQSREVLHRKRRRHRLRKD